MTQKISLRERLGLPPLTERHRACECRTPQQHISWSGRADGTPEICRHPLASAHDWREDYIGALWAQMKYNAENGLNPKHARGRRI